MATTTNLNTLKINYLTQAQFDALETKEANEIYLTPDASITTVTAGSGLSGGGSSGSVTLNHSNSVTAKSTQALYPITFDGQGHITGAGTAVTSLPASDVSSWAKASTKPSYTASEVGALASNTTYVSTITTTAGTHSAISSKSGTVSFNVPTKTSHLTNDSGFITSDSDENVKNTTITTASTIYLTGSTSSSTTTSGLSKHASANLYLTADSSTDGYSRLTLGNNTATGTAGARYGLLRLYGNTAYYVDIRTESGLPTGARTIYLPSYAGSMYLTCTSTTNAVGGATTAPVYVDDTGRIQVVTSIPYSLLTGTPTIPDVSGKIDTAGSGLSKSGTTLNHASTITAGTVGTSSATSGITLAVPYVTYNGTGHITATGTHTHTVPTASTTAAGVMSKEDKIYLNSLVNAISASSTILYLQTDSSTTDSSLLTAIDDLGWTSDVVS